MKKRVAVLLIAIIVILSIFAYKIYSFKIMQGDIKIENKTYESFLNKQVLGTDVMSIINKAENQNKQNEVQKDENDIYIENDTNSIKIDVKFKELDKVIPMESILKQGYNAFVYNFGALDFKCTKVEYHSKTNSIKYMYFEQI